MDFTLLVFFLFYANCRQKRTDTDTRCSKVVYFIDFQAGVNLAGTCQNVIDAVGCYGIETASEGI